MTIYTALLLLANLISSLITPVKVLAQVPDYNSWQTEATGLKTTLSANQSATAGLFFTLKQNDRPDFYLSAGLTQGSNDLHDVFLGSVGPAGSTGSFQSQTVDWAHNQMSYTINNVPITLTLSRLTPAVLIDTAATNLALFTGSVPAFKYLAYPTSAGTIRTVTLTTSPISLTDMSPDHPWVLIWYGANSQLAASYHPYPVFGNYATTSTYPADLPLLFRFQHPPSQIKAGSSGGIDFTFSQAAGLISFVPPLGMNLPPATDTAAWVNTLPNRNPASLYQNLTWWQDRLCQFPQTGRESYTYEAATDTISIDQTVTFVSVCSGQKFAPLPPMAALAHQVWPLTFSHPLKDAATPTAFGPFAGFDDTSTYTYRLTGLNRYVSAQRLAGSSQAPPELITQLEQAAQTAVTDGHYAPWIFTDNLPLRPYRGDIYWYNPADVLIHLVHIYEALPAGPTKDQFLVYLRSERNNYKPETVFKLSPLTGKIRQAWSYYTKSSDAYYEVYDPSNANNCTWGRCDIWDKQVPLQSLYSLARYYQITSDSLPSSLITDMNQIITNNLKESDWANFYNFKAFGAHRDAVVNINRNWAGALGYTRLARRLQNQPAEVVGMGLLTKMTLLKLGTTHYPRYLYQSGFTRVPDNPQWMLYDGHENIGTVFVKNWASPMDDHRQSTLLDQFRHLLQESTAYWDGPAFTEPFAWNWAVDSPRLTGYQNLTPELGLLLQDRLPEEALILAKNVESIFPHWYAAFIESDLGAEHNLAFPTDSYQVFLARAWIEASSPSTLHRYLDIPWLQSGDWFFQTKLAETVKAYQGWHWNVQAQTPSPSPTPFTGLDEDTDIDWLDFNLLISRFNQSFAPYNLVGTALIDIFDLNRLVGSL